MLGERRRGAAQRAPMAELGPGARLLCKRLHGVVAILSPSFLGCSYLYRELLTKSSADRSTLARSTR